MDVHKIISKITKTRVSTFTHRINMQVIITDTCNETLTLFMSSIYVIGSLIVMNNDLSIRANVILPHSDVTMFV